MNKSHLHRHLKRQIDKYLTDEDICNNPNLISFFETINQTYLKS